VSARLIRVLIVDDEPLGRQRIEDLLRAEPEVTIAGTADSGPRAVEAIRSLKPDLVFLDVQMPGKTGLDVVREVGASEMPATIFVTAYDRHALEAFELAAVDYLVKPFDDERFEQAFARARRLIELEEVDRLRGQLLSVLQGDTPPSPRVENAAPSVAPDAERSERTSAYLERIPVESRGKVRVVSVSEIDYIVASGPYAELQVGDRRHIIREAMQNLEDRLDPTRFVRIHRSVIVRIDLIDSLLRSPGGDYEVQLKNGAKLKVSRSRREELERRLGL
jgi:two-component system, LytTR family, response regulator